MLGFTTLLTFISDIYNKIVAQTGLLENIKSLLTSIKTSVSEIFDELVLIYGDMVGEVTFIEQITEIIFAITVLGTVLVGYLTAISGAVIATASHVVTIVNGINTIVTNLQSINNKMTQILAGVDTIEGTLVPMSMRLNNIDTNVINMNSNVSVMRTTLTNADTKLTNIKTDTGQINTKVGNIDVQTTAISTYSQFIKNSVCGSPARLSIQDAVCALSADVPTSTVTLQNILFHLDNTISGVTNTTVPALRVTVV